MNTITINNPRAKAILDDRRGPDSVWRLVAAEVSAFIGVIFTPRRIRAGIEKIAALHQAAARLDATDPARAAELRAEAARVTL